MPQNPQNCKHWKRLFCFEFMGIIHIGQKSRAHRWRINSSDKFNGGSLGPIMSNK